MSRASRRRRGALLSLLCSSALVVASALAIAAGDDRAQAEGILRDLEASPNKAVASELVASARGALDRGAKLRAGGDEAHAKIADSLARTWAEAAREYVRAASVEQSAAQARRDATDAGAIADRERALLEEAVAQSGRLRALVEAASKDGGKAAEPPRTSAAANTDAGTKPAPARPRDAGAPAARPATDGGAK